MHKRTLAAAALAAVLPFGAVTTACAERKSEAKPSPLPSVTPTPEPLTPQVAEREFNAYVANDDVARAANDERLALAWTADGQAALTVSEYRRAAFDGDPVKRYEYGKPKLYVPKADPKVYPHWFVAEVSRKERRAEGGGKGKGKTVYMAFTRRSAASSDQWRLSLVTEPDPKARLPKIPVDAQGYATPLISTDTSVLIRPREVPGIQATLASEGPTSIAADVMRTGWATTDYYQQSRKAKKKARDKHLTLQTVFVATAFPIFALRTDHGDGLVLYSLSRNSVTVAKDPKDKNAKPPIPAEVAHLLDGTVKGNQLDTAETLQFAALDPAKPKSEKDKPKAHVIARAGAITKATTPPPKTP